MRIAYKRGQMGRITVARRGKLEQLEHEYRLATAARQPHRGVSRGENVLDPRLESPLGRLNFLGKISKQELEAGIRYRNRHFQYLHAIGAPYPFNQSTDADGTSAGLMHSPGDEWCALWERNYKEARAAIAKMPRVCASIAHVVLYENDARCEYEVDLIRVGLAALAKHFGTRVEGAPNVIPFSKFLDLKV